MRNRIAIVAVSACLIMPAAAYTQTVGVAPASPITAADAEDTAIVNGVVTIRKIEFDDGKWKIEGRDRDGRYVEMKIDGRTGQIANLYRDEWRW